MTINWFSSTNATGSDASTYYNIIQQAIASACPTASCPPTFAAARVVRINWQNLVYELPFVNQSIVSTIFSLLNIQFFLSLIFYRMCHFQHI